MLPMPTQENTYSTTNKANANHNGSILVPIDFTFRNTDMHSSNDINNDTLIDNDCFIVDFASHQQLDNYSPTGSSASYSIHEEQLIGGENANQKHCIDNRNDENNNDNIKSFNENASAILRDLTHEVNTPLTSLRIIAEGLKDGAFSFNEDTLTTILNDINRIDDTFTTLKRYLEEDGRERTIGARCKIENELIKYCSASHDNNSDIDIILNAHGFTYRWQNEDKEASESKEATQEDEYLPHTGDYKLPIDFDEAAISKKELMTVIASIIDNSYQHAIGMTTIKIDVEDIFDNQNKMKCITIFDDGNGFKTENATVPFWKADESRTSANGYNGKKSSLGLGLSMAKKILAASNGKLEINSIENVGTKIKIQVPTI